MFTRSCLPWALAATLLAPMVARADMSPAEKDKERAEIRKEVGATLSKRYKQQPGGKAQIGKATGYAVLTNFGMKILVAGDGSGKDIAFDKSGKETS
jgi:hypothetical protein